MHFLQADQLPLTDWMSRDWHRRNLNQIVPLIKRFSSAMENELYRLAYTPDDHTALLQLWHDRDNLPHRARPATHHICHYDAFRRNLLAYCDKTVAIDWSFIGEGPVGADPAAMLWVSFVFNNISAMQFDDLYEPVLTSYIDGLRAAAWDGDENAVRTGYTLTYIHASSSAPDTIPC